MRTRLAFALALLLLASAAFAADSAASLDARRKQQNDIFAEYWETTLKLNPTLATSVGDDRYNDKLGDYSIAAIRRRHEINDAFLERMKAISPEGFEEEERTSHDLFIRNLTENDVDYELKTYEMPLGAQGGPHTQLADLPLSMPFDSVKHYDDYVARLHQIPKALAQVEETLRAGMKDGLVMVKFLAEKVPAQANGIVAADPFLLPIKKMPASFSDADKQRLTDAITAAVNGDVLPAYKKFATFVASEYAPHGRAALSIESLPGGKRRYQAAIHRLTTTDLSPAEIHKIGLSEYDRIVGEMRALAKANGYADLAAFREHIENDPKYKPASAQAILDDFEHAIAQMRTKLPQLFTLIPSAPVTVERIPEFQKAAATHYVPGSPDGKRPGRVVVAVSDFAHRSLINDEAVAYHEGIPGHHMQLSIQQTLTALPEFRKHGGNSAYAEGWALYAEELGKEVGFYQDPGSDYGRLRSELFRAVRLVVDTGIHDMGWTRDQVVDFMRKSHAVDEPTIQAETDRYISTPAQALSYKLGQLKIRELRRRAAQRLGARFDERKFHDAVLSGGSLPLDVLDARIERWSAEQERAAQAPPPPRALSLVRSGKLEEALALYQTEPNNAAANNGAGVVLDLLGRTSEARTYFNRAIELADTPAAKANARRALAMSYAFDNDCANAAKVEETVADYWASVPDYFRQGEVLNEAARVCIEAGAFDVAEQLYRRGAEAGLKEPNIAPARVALWKFRTEHALARLAARRGQPEEAKKHVAAARAILDANPEMAKDQEIFYPYLTGYVALYGGDAKTALADLGKARQDDPFIQFLMAQAYEKLGDMEQANALYRKAASTTAHNPPAAYARPMAAKKLAGK
ncbi:MAG TPA: DUF885 family protein [Thermoanaerobaculia bacterium]|jgi:uncharacterized protein (DUF885 family)